MAPLDWSQCPAVESIPGKVSGAWVFKGTRTPVAVVFENLEDGMSIDEVMEQFPVTREQVMSGAHLNETKGADIASATTTDLMPHDQQLCLGHRHHY